MSKQPEADAPSKRQRTEADGAKQPPHVVLGTMTFGQQVDRPGAQEMVETFDRLQQDCSFFELDTAHLYCEGLTETYLGELLSAEQRSRLVIATKANPWYSNGSLSPESITRQLTESLQRLRLEKVDLFYLHGPDNKTPLETTLRAVNDLHQRGLFSRFGISNYASWQVVEMFYICKTNQWITPSVYQGMYNAVTRAVEPELFPALRKLGMSFYAYNPLAGGLLTGKHGARYTSEPPAAGRFQRQLYVDRYWKPSYLDALGLVREACDAHGVSMTDAALRWCMHHSLMSGHPQDGVIIGASSMQHLRENMHSCKQGGPLPNEIVQSLDHAWDTAKGDCPVYFRP